LTAKRYSDLIVWQKAMNLVEEVYKITNEFPREETYGLTQQVRRAAVSVPSDIAEGHSRTGNREFAHRLSIAHCPLSELETQIEIARRLGYVREGECPRFGELASETGRLSNGLLRKLAPGPGPLAPSSQS